MALPLELPVLIVPGYGDSEPGHWQSLWENRWPGSQRVRQRDWDHPERSEWVDTLEAAVHSMAMPPLLIGHSLGCTTIAEWSAQSQRPVLGAFLVAPPDPRAPGFPRDIQGYGRPYEGPLRFPTLLAASTDDPYATWARCIEMAVNWGAELVNCGPRGHINLESGHGEWPEGEALLITFAGRCSAQANRPK